MRLVVGPGEATPRRRRLAVGLQAQVSPTANANGPCWPPGPPQAWPCPGLRPRLQALPAPRAAPGMAMPRPPPKAAHGAPRVPPPPPLAVAPCRLGVARTPGERTTTRPPPLGLRLRAWPSPADVGTHNRQHRPGRCWQRQASVALVDLPLPPKLGWERSSTRCNLARRGVASFAGHPGAPAAGGPNATVASAVVARPPVDPPSARQPRNAYADPSTHGPAFPQHHWSWGW